MCPMTAAQTEAACDAMKSQNQKPTIVTVELKFNGVTFDPSDLYDALNAQWPVVASDKDNRGGFEQGDFSFTITP